MLLLAAPALAAAHGFGQRFDLPLPLWLWVSGAGASIVLTFAVMAFFVRELPPRAPPRAAIAISRSMRAAAAALRSIAAAVFVLSLAAGFFGSQDPYRNLLPTMVWVIWWVGFAFVCALVADLWALVNPFSTLFAWTERLLQSASGRRLPALAQYPQALGAWPAVVLFLAFAWAELVWRDNDVPWRLACAVLAYSLVTWLGMLLFGRRTWLENGEAFGIAFGILARFAPLEARPDGLRLRMPGSGLVAERALPRPLRVFVILMLASVTFDGLLETPLYQQWSTALQQWPGLSSLLFHLSEYGADESGLIASATLLLTAVLFLVAYRLGTLGMGEAAGSFVLSLVPIAVAYHLSHYFSLLLTAGQFIIPLASDPFGFGWNLFGTAAYKVDLGIVDPYVFWYSAVALIVTGHAIAVWVAHLEAVRAFGSRAALTSQLPLVALMVGYTTLSLWILAQPIVG